MTALVTPGTEVPGGVTGATMHRRAPGRWAAAEHDVRLPFDLARQRGDVVHAPGHEAPRRCRSPWTFTLHDVIPLVDDDPAYAAARRRWQRMAPRVRLADAVIANSRHSADEGTRVLGLDPRKVHVAPLGVDACFTPGPATDAPPYVLVVAEHGPNKGFADAFAAAGALADHAGLRLLVAGRLAPWVRPVVEGLRAAAPRPEAIELLDWVPDARLVELYRGAVALLVPSRAEGFCLPAAEAMACATPVVAYANSALVETVGDGGCLVPDGDVAAAVAAVASLTDPQRRADASAAALRRAEGFDWQRCADVHAAVWRDVAGR